jgi:hypothetical protein
MYFILGGEPPACSAPFGSYTCGHWRVSIGIPPQLFRPGVLRLGSQSLNASYSVQGPDEGGGQCYGGGGSFFDGTIEIVSIAENGDAVIRVADTQKFEFNADGTYQAHRCP